MMLMLVVKKIMSVIKQPSKWDNVCQRPLDITQLFKIIAHEILLKTFLTSTYFITKSRKAQMPKRMVS
jgi:hypothetical protein